MKNTDLISRQAAIDVINKIFPADPMRNDYTEGITCGAALATEYIKQLPSAEPKKGRWVDIVEMDSGGYPFKVGVCCSVCGFETLSEDNYCPCCGVKMSEIPTDSESEDKE